MRPEAWTGQVSPSVRIVQVRSGWRVVVTSRFVRHASGQPVTASAIAPKQFTAFTRAVVALTEIELHLVRVATGQWVMGQSEAS